MTPGSPQVTALVVDDHPVVRYGLATLLSAEDWVASVIEAPTAEQARSLATTRRPDVAVIDLGLPDGDGIDLIAYLAATSPACGLLVMTMTRDRATVRAALAAGALGYLLKDTEPALLVAAIRTVAAGGRVFGPSVEAGPEPAAAPSPLDRLTVRERQILGLVADGLSNPDISRRLMLSEKTVRNLVSQVITRLGVTSRVQAALLARKYSGQRGL